MVKLEALGTSGVHEAHVGYCGVNISMVLYDFLGTVKAAPHKCVIRTSQP